MAALLVLAASARLAALTLDAREAGAVPDGRALCTAVLQQCLDRCAAAGGGTVVLPPGIYRSGTLDLRSRVTLRIEAGATLLGSADPRDYPARRPAVRSYTDNYVSQALLAGEDLEQVAIEGGGVIDGNGGAFKWKEYLTRPYVIRLVACRDVRVEGVTLQASPMWMQHYLACDRVRLRGLRVFNHVSYNNDGLDLDGCHDVQVSDCVIDSDDDALCLKSTLDRACENITITNCVLSSHCNAFKLGTESNGGFRNITFSNNVIVSPRSTQAMYGVQRGMGGIALETVDGGHLDNVVVSNVAIRGVHVPIFLRLGNRARPFLAGAAKPPLGSFRRVMLSNIVATGAGRIGCSITGVPGGIAEDITLANVSLEFEGGGGRDLAAKPVPERADAYPESRMFGDLPAYGLYCRHLRGLRVSGLQLRTVAPDARHALVADDVERLEIDGLDTTSAPGAAAVVRLQDARQVLVRGARPAGPVDVFLHVAGPATREVVLVASHLASVGRPVVVATEVLSDTVRESDQPHDRARPR
ncbi:MAG: glycoside hydrolase [Verrucomicrobia bacterium]|nr:glycoside hydrolase [Verrucomicrobiota bacterium]